MGDEINITFETLYDLLRREKGKEELQNLEVSFYKDVVSYLQEKLRLLEQKSRDDDLFSVGEKDKLEAEMRQIKRILKEFYDKREKKIIEMAINRSRTGSDIIDTSALLSDEKNFYEEMVRIFDRFRIGVLFNIFKGQMPAVAEGKKIVVEEKQEVEQESNVEKARIKIVNPVPKFVNPIDGGFLGPFENGVEVEIEKGVAELLVEKKRAEFLP